MRNLPRPPSWVLRLLLVIALALAGVLGSGCKKKDAGPPSALDELAESLINVRVVSTPLELRVPKHWEVRDIDHGKVPPRPAAPAAGTPEVKLTGRLLFVAEAPDTDGKRSARPRLEIFHDPWLPVGTSAQDYLDAQRKENERAVKAGAEGAASAIAHVESERSRRQGRPSYHVRDEWTFTVGDQQAVVHQESLLLIDKEGDDLHGYTLVMTMTEDDRKDLDLLRRAVIESVRFAKE